MPLFTLITVPHTDLELSINYSSYNLLKDGISGEDDFDLHKNKSTDFYGNLK